jgi:hypothetical protein
MRSPYPLRESLNRPRHHVIPRAHGGHGAYARRGRGERFGWGTGHQTQNMRLASIVGQASETKKGASGDVSRRARAKRGRRRSTSSSCESESLRSSTVSVSYASRAKVAMDMR